MNGIILALIMGTVLFGFAWTFHVPVVFADDGQGTVSYSGRVNVSDLHKVKSHPHLFTMPFLPKNQAAYTHAKSEPSPIGHNSSWSGPAKMEVRPSAAIPLAVQIMSQFNGLNQSQCGCSPPDVQIAVGPNDIVEMVNTEEEIWQKNGQPVTDVSLYDFYSVSQNDFLSDPRIFFDQVTDRWFSSILDASTNSVMVAVSGSDDPTKSWGLYDISFGANCPDQPSIAANEGLFVVSANDFTNCLTSPTLVGAQYFVLNKTQLVQGSQNPTMRSFGPDVNEFSIMPVKALGRTPTLYMVTVEPDSTKLRLYSISGTASNPLVQTQDLPIRAVSIPPGASQKGTSIALETDDDRILDAAWTSGRIWLALTDGCTPAGDSEKRSCVRLTEVDTNSSKVVQDFDAGTAGTYYFYPALTMDSRGDLDAVFGYSSASSYPGLMVATQGPSDPGNSLGSLQIFAVGAAPDTSGRYGDYFSAARDPSNTTNVFFAGEIHPVVSSSPSPWSTIIGSTAYVSAPEFPAVLPVLLAGLAMFVIYGRVRKGGPISSGM